MGKLKIKKHKQSIDKNILLINKEEHYILKLIKSQGISTNNSKWEFNLKFLIENYDDIKNIKHINMHHINSYIKSYKYVLISKEMPDEKENFYNVSSIRSKSYDRDLALIYAKKYVYNYNEYFPNWSKYGGDCTNFISQCLYAGGKKMIGTDPQNFNSWFSYGTTPYPDTVSSTWRGADAFKLYWMKNANAYKTFTSIDENSWNYGKEGDVVSFLTDNRRSAHTMILTGYDKPDFILSAHSANTNNASLYDKFTAGNYSSFIIYNMD